MLHTPFYDPNKSYEENYEQGPFGAFIDGKVYEQQGEPQYDFHGVKVYLPFGIAAGTILNSKFAKGAFEKGFDVLVYKTVRSGVFPCHPWPNIVPVDINGDLTVERMKQPLIKVDDYQEPLTITNSFGVPSRDPSWWQEDVKKAISYAGKGQVLILSFMGTVKPEQTEAEFIEDHRIAARQALETGAQVFEVNLSCPNIGNEGLICYNLGVSEKVLDAIKGVIGDKPLLVKIGHYQDQSQLEKMAVIINKYAQGVSAINTLQAEIRNKDGEQALPGSPARLRSGVCGSAIKWAGIDMVKKFVAVRNEKGYNYKVEGVGGVMEAQDYFDYKNAGADSVMSVTGSMWNPFMAQEIKAKLS